MYSVFGEISMLQCDRCFNNTCVTKLYNCEQCPRIMKYCRDCVVTVDQHYYCKDCTTPCLCCADYSFNKDMPLCHNCFSCAVRDLMSCLADNSPYKYNMPQYIQNARMVLKRPMIDRELTQIFKQHVSWSIQCQETSDDLSDNNIGPPTREASLSTDNKLYTQPVMSSYCDPFTNICNTGSDNIAEEINTHASGMQIHANDSMTYIQLKKLCSNICDKQI